MNIMIAMMTSQRASRRAKHESAIFFFPLRDGAKRRRYPEAGIQFLGSWVWFHGVMHVRWLGMDIEEQEPLLVFELRALAWFFRNQFMLIDEELREVFYIF